MSKRQWNAIFFASIVAGLGSMIFMVNLVAAHGAAQVREMPKSWLLWVVFGLSLVGTLVSYYRTSWQKLTDGHSNGQSLRFIRKVVVSLQSELMWKAVGGLVVIVTIFIASFTVVTGFQALKGWRLAVGVGAVILNFVLISLTVFFYEYAETGNWRDSLRRLVTFDLVIGLVILLSILRNCGKG